VRAAERFLFVQATGGRGQALSVGGLDPLGYWLKEMNISDCPWS